MEKRELHQTRILGITCNKSYLFFFSYQGPAGPKGQPGRKGEQVYNIIICIVWYAIMLTC